MEEFRVWKTLIEGKEIVDGSNNFFMGFMHEDFVKEMEKDFIG